MEKNVQIKGVLTRAYYQGLVMKLLFQENCDSTRLWLPNLIFWDTQIRGGQQSIHMYINMFAMAKKYFETQINVEQQSIHINMFTVAKKMR